MASSRFVLFLGLLSTSCAAPLSTRDNPHGQTNTPTLLQLSKRTGGQYWPGWSGIQNVFAFGDSYTTTGFTPTGTQPSPDNPLGNPFSVNAPFGYTAVNGPGYVEQLTVAYNQSQILTYNLAIGGATIDSTIIPRDPPVLSFKEQVNDLWFPYYQETNQNANWTSSNTLFSVFFGINDVGMIWGKPDFSTTLDAILNAYGGQLEELYQAGAKNFLLLNVPPVNLAPLTTAAGPDSVANEGSAIDQFNAGLANLAEYIENTYSDTTVTLFDTHSLFSQVLSNPQVYQQTSIYQNTADYCASYANGTPQEDTFYPECGIPVNQYFWLNTLHPTYPLMDVVAQSISQALAAI